MTGPIVSEVDWNVVLSKSLRHKVFPIVYQNIKRYTSESLPPGILAQFKLIYLQNATRNLRYSIFLNKCIELLNIHRIDVLPFKGPVIANYIYGGIELRQFSDLDILVKKVDAATAWEVFLTHGFKPSVDIKPAQRDVYIKVEDHAGFSKGDIYVELHWEMSGLYLSQPVYYNMVSAHIQPMELINSYVPNLKIEYLIVYTCVHASKHGWNDLDSICCLNQLLKKNFDWDIVNELASKWRCRLMLGLGIFITNQLLGGGTIKNIVLSQKEQKVIHQLATEIFTNLTQKTSVNQTTNMAGRFSIFHLKVRDSITDKILYSFRLIFCPTDKEWLYYPVPAPISFLHFLLRPYRLLLTQLRKQKC